MLTRRLGAVVALVGVVAAVLLWELWPAAGGNAFCDASNAEKWVAALRRHPLGVAGTSIHGTLRLEVGGEHVVVTGAGGTDHVELWTGASSHREIYRAPRGLYVTALDAGSGWVALSTARNPSGRYLGRDKGYSQEHLEAVEVSTGRLVHLADQPVAGKLDAPLVVDGGIWWSTHDAAHGTGHRYDLRTGARATPTKAAGKEPTLIRITTGLVWNTGPRGLGLPGADDVLEYVLRTPLPPLVAAAHPPEGEVGLASDGQGFAWASRAGIRWWRPGMKQVALVPFPKGGPGWGAGALMGPFVWANRATEGSQEAYLDLRTGAMIQTRRGGPGNDLGDPTDWMSTGPHYVPMGDGSGPTEYYEVVPSDLPELRC